MRAAIFADEDVAGQAWALTRAVNEHTAHECRAFVRRETYLGYPRSTGPEDVSDDDLAYLRSIDVAHVFDRYQRANRWGRLNPDARWYMHQHGELDRGWCKGVPLETHLSADRSRKSLRIVSTLNLLPYVGDDVSRWLPSCLHLDRFDVPAEPHEGIWVGHTPTNRAGKGTQALIAAVDSLKAEGLDLTLKIGEGITWAESIALKASGDIIYDQPSLCYGVSALEAWALSKPVLVGMSDETDAKVREIAGYRPYIRVSPETLVDKLRSAATDATLRRSYGMLGRDYVEEFHTPKTVAERVCEIWRFPCVS